MCPEMLIHSTDSLMHVLPACPPSGVFLYMCVCVCACAGVHEDCAVANTLPYLLCQKPSSLEEGSVGGSHTSFPPSSRGGSAVSTAQWWEVLSAVQGLAQESQQHICALFGVEVSACCSYWSA